MAPESFNHLNCKQSTVLMILQEVNFQISFKNLKSGKQDKSASLSVWYQNQITYNEMNIPKGK
jgi:hypothetical protein